MPPGFDRLAQLMRRYRLDDDRPNIETSLERLMRQALDLACLSYEDQAHVGRYRPDFIVTIDGARVVVECDGPHHKQPAQIVKDRRKDAAYMAAGMRVYRFTDAEIRKSAVACVESLLQRERLVHAADQLVKAAPDAADDDSRALR